MAPRFDPLNTIIYKFDEMMFLRGDWRESVFNWGIRKKDDFFLSKNDIKLKLTNLYLLSFFLSPAGCMPVCATDGSKKVNLRLSSLDVIMYIQIKGFVVYRERSVIITSRR